MKRQVNYRALIVDDEPVARDVIRVLLENYPQVEVCEEATDGFEAIAAINSMKPDVVFIDIHMPLLDGLKVVQSISNANMPYFVFTTAYDEHALKAFELNAIDYLLKPFDKSRFESTMKKVFEVLKFRDLSSMETRLMKFANEYMQIKEKHPATPADQKFAKKITVKDSKRIVFIDVTDIVSINASGDYIEICYNGKKQLLYKNLNEIYKELDPSSFFRIHRSHIINSNKIKEIRPHQNGEYHFYMVDDQIIKSSRSNKSIVQTIIDY